jgi:hypothetical protein
MTITSSILGRIGVVRPYGHADDTISSCQPAASGGVGTLLIGKYGNERKPNDNHKLFVLITASPWVFARDALA